MNFVTFGTILVPSAVFRFMSPARTFGTDRTLCFNLLDYILLLILQCSLEDRTIFDPLCYSFSSRFVSVFVSFFVAGKTDFTSSLEGYCSLGHVAFPRICFSLSAVKAELIDSLVSISLAVLAEPSRKI